MPMVSSKARARSTTCAVVLLLVIAGSALSASAAVRCVNPLGAGTCSATIQGAVDAAAEGDTIVIGAGTYYENVIVNKAGLKLQGASKLTTILDASTNSAVPVTL